MELEIFHSSVYKYVDMKIWSELCRYGSRHRPVKAFFSRYRDSNSYLEIQVELEMITFNIFFFIEMYIDIYT